MLCVVLRCLVLGVGCGCCFVDVALYVLRAYCLLLVVVFLSLLGVVYCSLLLGVACWLLCVGCCLLCLCSWLLVFLLLPMFVVC